MELSEIKKIQEIEDERVVYINSDLYPGGQFVPGKDARLSVFDRGFTVGDNTYEYARTYNHEPFQVKEHVDRMFKSLRVLRINPGLSGQDFERICSEVTKRNEPLLEYGEEYNIIIEVTRGEYGWHARRVPPLPGKGNPTIIVKNSINDMKRYARAYMLGRHLATTSSRHTTPDNWDPKIKTYSRLAFVLAQHKAKLMDPQAAAVFLDQSGNLTETVGDNIFLVEDGVLKTPGTHSILRGITRSNVIQIAKKLGIPVVECDLQEWNLHNCDEAFTSTTSLDVCPVSHFNGLLVGKELPGPITKRICKAYSDWVGEDITGLNFISAEEKAKLEEENTKLNEELTKLAHVPY